MPEVSVIIPVYNIEKFVEKCIRSVTGQTFRDLEILVVNDGSTDRSGEILERLAAEDSRIVYISQENRGVAAARNRAAPARSPGPLRRKADPRVPRAAAARISCSRARQ